MSDDERARLEAAGLVAPIVRGMDETTLRRRVHTYDRETGEPVREVTVRQLIGGLAKVTALEVEVIEGKRPTSVPCECGKTIAVKAKGKIPKKCTKCLEVHCAGCGKLLPRNYNAPSLMRRHGGQPRCLPCIKKHTESKSITCSGCGTLLPRTRRWAEGTGMCKPCFDAKRSQEAASLRPICSACGGKLSNGAAYKAKYGLKKTGPCLCKGCYSGRIRAEVGKANAARYTPERRSEVMRKAWATRRAKAAAVLSSEEDGLPQKTSSND
jgi:hypothetical protein